VKRGKGGEGCTAFFRTTLFLYLISWPSSQWLVMIQVMRITSRAVILGPSLGLVQAVCIKFSTCGRQPPHTPPPKTLSVKW
jgi:hypothetical protein